MIDVRRKYPHPPVQEAICEAHFVETAWDFVTPSALFSALSGSYPEPPVEVRGSDLELATDGTVRQLLLESQAPKVRFSADAGRFSVIAGPRSVSVHAARPYCGWEELRERLDKALNLYARIARPGPVSRTGIRYVNRIEIPDIKFPLDRFFTQSPSLPESTVGGIYDFFQRVEARVLASDARVIVNFGTIREPDVDHPTFILDIDVFERWSGRSHDDANFPEHFERLRDFERDIFESLITDELRALFLRQPFEGGTSK